MNVEMTQDQAIRLAKTEWWKRSDVQTIAIAIAQLFQDRLFMNFGDFQLSVDRALDRPTWTHEYANPATLQEELIKRLEKEGKE